MDCTAHSSGHHGNHQGCWLDIILNNENSSYQQKESAFDYARHNFMEIVKKDDFLQLDIDSFKNLLRPDDLNVTSEEVVFKAVKRWLDFNNINPYDSLDSLLEVVRLPLVSPEFLITEVLPYGYPITKCQHYMNEALRYHMIPTQRSKLSKDRTTPRRPSNKGSSNKRPISEEPSTGGSHDKFGKVLAVGSTDFNTSPILELYDYDQNKWTSLKRLNIGIRNYAAALVNEELLLIGGYDGKATNAVYSVDLSNGLVTSVASLHAARFNFWATVVGEGEHAEAYVVGGHGAGVLNGVEKWDSHNRNWVRLASMNVARECCGVTNLDGKIYAAGGINGHRFYNSLEIYDINSNVWRNGAPMNQVRSFCTLAASETHVYAMGGHSQRYGLASAIKKVERYDPKTNVWTILTNITASGIVGAALNGDKILVAGGWNSNIAEEYDVNTNTSRRLAPLNFNRSLVTIIPLPGYLSTLQFTW